MNMAVAKAGRAERAARDLASPARDPVSPARVDPGGALNLLTMVGATAAIAKALASPERDLASPARDLANPARDPASPARVGPGGALNLVTTVGAIAVIAKALASLAREGEPMKYDVPTCARRLSRGTKASRGSECEILDYFCCICQRYGVELRLPSVVEGYFGSVRGNRMFYLLK